jgi:pyruvate carboxylase
MMRGNLGQPPGGFPEGILKKVLKDEKPNHRTPRQARAPVDLEAKRAEVDRRELEGRSMTRT